MAFKVLLLLAVIGCIQCKLLNLSCDHIKKFVDGHNSRRQQLVKGSIRGQPAASEMKYMIWDEELAAKAARWASSYRQNHNPDKTIGSRRFKTGENLYWYSTSDRNYNLNPDMALEAWFSEYKDFYFGPMRSSHFGGSKQIGHYTQMAWSDSTHVGCAISQWPISGWNKFFVVCNYGPAGNFMGQTPYKRGNPGGRLVCGTQSCSRPYGNRC